MQPIYQKHGVTLYCGDLRDVLPTLPASSVDYVVTDPPYGLGFMEKDWDHEVPGPVFWQAIDRVCKPGSALLAFGGTKTYHRLTCAIEDAGWEIRDCLMWLQGQGMPKAGDIGKLIDKAKGACLLAAKFTGWATALKPSWEPIVLASKGVDGTLAQNAEKWGVAGLHIDVRGLPVVGLRQQPTAGRRRAVRQRSDAESHTWRCHSGGSQPIGQDWPSRFCGSLHG